jgi:uncharacterized protein
VADHVPTPVPTPAHSALAAAASAFEVGAPRAITVADETLQLYGGRALHWHRADALLIADLHLGKGEVFRRAGLAVPRGGTRDDLARLAALLAATRASRLIVLGDVLHGALHAEAGWRDDWQAFRDAHAALHVEAVVGNHDRALVSGAALLGLALRDDGAVERGLALCHEPDRAPRGEASLCGHLHPAAKVPGLGKLPAFWHRSAAQQLVLPAFSAFTGRIVPRLAAGDARYACAGHAVLPPLVG